MSGTGGDGSDDPVWGAGQVVRLSAARGMRGQKADAPQGDAADGSDPRQRRAVRHCVEDWSLDDVPERPWVAEGHLLRGAVTVLAGAGGAGKSLLAVKWGIACALGKQIGRFRPRGRLKVCYYCIEDDEHELRKRISASIESFAAALPDMEGRFMREHPEGDPELFRWGISDDGRSFELIPTRAWEEILGIVDEEKPDVFIFDPMIETNTAPENDNGAQRAVITQFRLLARRNHMAVMVVDHSRKTAEGFGQTYDDANEVRGAGSKVAASRLTVVCKTMLRADAEQWNVPQAARHAYLKVSAAKANYGPRSDGEWFEKTEVMLRLKNGREEASPSLIPWAPPGESVLPPEVLADLLTEIARGWDGEPYISKDTPDDWSIRMLLERYGIRDAKARQQAKDLLKKAGAIMQPHRSKRHRKRVIAWRHPNGLPVSAWLVPGADAEGNPAMVDETHFSPAAPNFRAPDDDISGDPQREPDAKMDDEIAKMNGDFAKMDGVPDDEESGTANSISDFDLGF